MAIINKYQIRRYKEVIVDVQPGTIEDGGFSTFNLDNPSSGRFGTSDFVGTIKKVVLLGEVIKETLDTGNVGIGQFNQLTQQDFQNQLTLGTFVYNKTNRGQATVIGWVELGNTYPSFYYEDCITGNNQGKLPISENYYDLGDFNASQYTVSGEGQGAAALQRMGSWEYGQSLGNWGIAAFPGQQPMELSDYMFGVLNGGVVQGGTVTAFNSPILGQIPMLMATYEENFQGNNKYTLTPSFANNNGLSKEVYGRIRRTITQGFRPSVNLQKNSASCISTGVVTTIGPSGGGVVTTTPTEISTQDLLQQLMKSLNKVYPNFRYNPLVVTEETSFVNIFTQDFPEMDSFKQTLTYRYQQDSINSDMSKLLKKLDEEVKGIKSTDISSNIQDKQNI